MRSKVKVFLKTKWMYLTFPGVLILWAVSPFVYSYLFDSFEEERWATRGQFGDTFGAVNSLFTGLAFAGLIITIVLQRKDLNIQSETLRLQAEETKRLADQTEGQRTLMNLQRENHIHFESLIACGFYLFIYRYVSSGNGDKVLVIR